MLISKFLGLSDENVDWDEITGVGLYNVAGREGYNVVTGWDEAKDAKNSEVIPPRVVEMMKVLVAEERKRLNDMRKRGFFMGKECEWT